MRFLISFYITFIMLSSLIVMIEGSNEMFAYLIWFHLINITVGSMGWLLINNIIKSSSIFLLGLKFFAGLLVQNVVVYYLDGGIPSFTLIGLGKKYDSYWVSVFLHLLFLTSFLVAFFPDIKALKNVGDKRNGV